MEETVEFRMAEEDAAGVLAPDDGVTLGGSVRRLRLSSDDRRMDLIRTAQCQAVARGDVLVLSWDVERKYSHSELKSAELFQFVRPTRFEPCGEECGTVYDEEAACPHCDAGAKRLGDLYLSVGRIPRGVDVAITIGGEWVVSQRLAETMIDRGLTGFTFGRIRARGTSDQATAAMFATEAGATLLQRAGEIGLSPDGPNFWVWANRAAQRPTLETASNQAAQLHRRRAIKLPFWHELIVSPPYVPMGAETLFGISFVETDASDVSRASRCERGDTLGLNIISELFVEKGQIPAADLAATKEFIGHRMGLLRPERLLLASPALRETFVEAKVSGVEFEVVRA